MGAGNTFKGKEVITMFKVSSAVFRAAAVTSARRVVKTGVALCARPVAHSSALFSTATESTTTLRPEPQTAPTLTQVCIQSQANHM